jgi:hypothetical protein
MESSAPTSLLILEEIMHNTCHNSTLFYLQDGGGSNVNNSPPPQRINTMLPIETIIIV